MKNNKGFTLIELTAVIVILALVSLLSFPAILNQIKKSNDNLDSGTRKLIISAAKDYIEKYNNAYPKNRDNIYCVPIQALINEGLFSKDTIDAKTTNKIDTNRNIKITNNETKYEYEILDNNVTCTGTSPIYLYIEGYGNTNSNGTGYNSSLRRYQSYTYEDSTKLNDGDACENAGYCYSYENVDNYIQVDGKKLRILSIDSSNNVKVIDDKSEEPIIFSNSSNLYSVSSLKSIPTSIDNRYLVDYTITDSEYGYDELNDEYGYNILTGQSNVSVGNITAEEYLNASSNGSICLASGESKNCVNWLNDDSDFWTATTSMQGSSSVEAVTPIGLVLTSYNYSYYYRPVILLKSTLMISGGNGKFDNPFIVVNPS